MDNNETIVFLCIILLPSVCLAIVIGLYYAHKNYLYYKKQKIDRQYDSMNRLYNFLKDMREEGNGDIFITIINHKKIKKNNIHQYTADSIANGEIVDIYTTRKVSKNE